MKSNDKAMISITQWSPSIISRKCCIYIYYLQLYMNFCAKLSGWFLVPICFDSHMVTIIPKRYHLRKGLCRSILLWYTTIYSYMFVLWNMEWIMDLLSGRQDKLFKYSILYTVVDFTGIREGNRNEILDRPVWLARYNLWTFMIRPIGL